MLIDKNDPDAAVNSGVFARMGGGAGQRILGTGLPGSCVSAPASVGDAHPHQLLLYHTLKQRNLVAVLCKGLGACDCGLRRRGHNL